MDITREKILIVGVDSQFIHSMLSIHCIYANTRHENVDLFECNINMDVAFVATEILAHTPDIVAFSTYIFNIEFIVALSKLLRESGIVVVFGGIEVENNNDAYAEFCDHILIGDGEIVFDEFLFGDRKQKIVRATTSADLSKINSPYTEKYFELTKGKIAYFEASRGCPFKCSYCMSANSKLSLSSLERVFADLTKFQGKDLKVLKFVDRTFNAKADYSNAIVKFVVENQDRYGYQIHFEIAPELINDEMIEILKTARPNFIRMEIGMQSLNADTLKKINRPFDVERLLRQIEKLSSLPNIDCHVDIIAGLPFENFQSLTTTFDKLYKLQPTEIQLGLLKLLPNSPLYIEKIDGYVHNDTPPYQITQSKWLSKTEIDEVLRTEQVVNRLYNSGRFKETLKYIFNYFHKNNHKYSSQFVFFHDFAMSQANLQSLSLFDLYGATLDFACECGLSKEVLIDLMRFDVASTNNSRALPKSLFVKYNKKYKQEFDKSRYYLLPLFHNIFADCEEKETQLLFDYSNYDYLNRRFSFTIEAI